MGKIDDLKNFVAKLFENATDAETIKNAGIVASKIDEIKSEQDSKENEYKELLKDYKDVVIHNSFKPNKGKNDTADGPSSFDASTTLARVLAENEGK